jgi:hypothetical protein
MKYVFLILLGLYGLPAAAQTYLVNDSHLRETTADSTLEYGSPLPYYYGVGGKYPTNSTTLLRSVQAYLSQQKAQSTVTGYITYRFIVDTTGRPLHKVKVMQTDDHYKAIRFEQGIVDALGAFVYTLDKWKIARYQSGGALEYIAFISFKLKDGKVINIIP